MCVPVGAGILCTCFLVLVFALFFSIETIFLKDIETTTLFLLKCQEKEFDHEITSWLYLLVATKLLLEKVDLFVVYVPNTVI